MEIAALSGAELDAWVALAQDHCLRDMEAARPQPMFEAMLRRDRVTWFAEGELPLIAAMRVYVRSRFSDEQLRSPPF